MGTHCIILQIEDIKRFILEEGESINKTSLEELTFGLVVAKFHSRMEGHEFSLGLPVKRNIRLDLYDNQNDLHQIALALSKWEEKDSPLDFIIIRSDVDLSLKENRQGIPY